MNHMQAYFDLKEINRNLEKVLQVTGEIELENPELQEAREALEKARNQTTHAVEEFERTFSVD